MLEADPVTAAVVRAALGITGHSHWLADLLTPSPSGEDIRFDAELADVRSTVAGVARVDLRAALAGALPPQLDRDDLAGRAADVLAWVWRESVQPYWPRRRRVLETDVVARTAQLTRHGWVGALGNLRPGMRWLGDGPVRIIAHDHPNGAVRAARSSTTAPRPLTRWSRPRRSRRVSTRPPQR